MNNCVNICSLSRHFNNLRSRALPHQRLVIFSSPFLIITFLTHFLLHEVGFLPLLAFFAFLLLSRLTQKKYRKKASKMRLEPPPPQQHTCSPREQRSLYLLISLSLHFHHFVLAFFIFVFISRGESSSSYYLDVVVVVPPTGFLGIFVASLDIERVIWRPFLKGEKTSKKIRRRRLMRRLLFCSSHVVTFSFAEASMEMMERQTDCTLRAGLQSSVRMERQM